MRAPCRQIGSRRVRQVGSRLAAAAACPISDAGGGLVLLVLFLVRALSIIMNFASDLAPLDVCWHCRSSIGSGHCGIWSQSRLIGIDSFLLLFLHCARAFCSHRSSFLQYQHPNCLSKTGSCKPAASLYVPLHLIASSGPSSASLSGCVCVCVVWCVCVCVLRMYVCVCFLRSLGALVHEYSRRRRAEPQYAPPHILGPCAVVF